MTAYRVLEQRFRRLGAIEQAISVLHWDTAAIMPEGGAAARADQLATLRLIAHQHLVAPEIETMLAEADAASDELGEWQRANLREMRRRWLHATTVPGALVEAESRACSECEAVWRRGRLENDFAAVLPGLERILLIEREIAAGVRLNSIVRHMLGLFTGVPGARAFRRHLATAAVRPGAGAEVLREALSLVADSTTFAGSAAA